MPNISLIEVVTLSNELIFLYAMAMAKEFLFPVEVKMFLIKSHGTNFHNKDAYDLEKTVYGVIGEMDMEADFRNCFIECDVRCDELGLSW